jgi:hypothetical protein
MNSKKIVLFLATPGALVPQKIELFEGKKRKKETTQNT